MADLQALPFFFRRLGKENGCLLTNVSGAFSYLNECEHVQALIDPVDLNQLGALKVDELISKSFLCEPSEVETRLRVFEGQLATRWARSIDSNRLFMVVPTLRCDHDCRYCQAARAPIHAKGVDLDPKHIEVVVRTIKSLCGGNPAKVEFQGGEPLLAFDFIKEFVSHAEGELPAGSEYVICSALGPLTPEILAWCQGNPVTFSVSLDGTEGIHTSNRPSKHFNSQTHTIDGIDRIRSALGKEKVACIATITRETLTDPIGFVDTYFNLDLESVFFRPISPFGFASKPKDSGGYSVAEYGSFYRKCLDHILDLNSRRLFVDELSLIHLTKIFRPHQSQYVDLQSPSGHLFGALLFNYDGRIFGSDEARMLWEITREDSLSVGHIDDLGKSSGWQESSCAILKESFIECTPGCDECAYQPYCGANPLHHLATQGEPVGNKARSRYCALQREIFDSIFTLLKDSPMAREIFQRWLNR